MFTLTGTDTMHNCSDCINIGTDSNGSFTLQETHSGTDSDSDPIPVVGS